MTEEKEKSVLEQFMDDGAIAPLWVTDPNLHAALSVLDKLADKPIEATDSNYIRAAQDPRAQSSYDDTRGEVYVSAAALGVYELARFVVPAGNVGIVKQIQQYVRRIPALIPVTMSGGLPFELERLEVFINWHLRLDALKPGGWCGTVNTNSLMPNSLYFDSPSGYLPGLPFTDHDLAVTPFLRWPWTDVDSGNVDLLVPGGYALRFFADYWEGLSDIYIAGRLSGYWQTEICNAAQYNVRRVGD